MQTTAARRHHHSPRGRLIRKTSDAPAAGQRARGRLDPWVAQPLWKSPAVSHQTKHALPVGPSKSTLGRSPSESKTYVYKRRNTSTKMCRAAGFATTPNRKRPNASFGG